MVVKSVTRFSIWSWRCKLEVIFGIPCRALESKAVQVEHVLLDCSVSWLRNRRTAFKGTTGCKVGGSSLQQQRVLTFNLDGPCMATHTRHGWRAVSRERIGLLQLVLV